MTHVIVYATETCPYCVRAEELLTRKGVHFQTIRVDSDPEMLAEMMRITGRRSVPQIIINAKPIGGFDDLYALDQSGQLDVLLQEKADE